MKKLATFLICLIANYNYSQMAVVDAGVNSTLATQLSTSTSQLAQLEKSYTALKNAADKVDKVASMVKTINNINEIIGFQKEAINNVSIVMKKSKKDGSYNSKLKVLNSSLTNITGNIASINKILTNGFFSMTDKERIDYFSEKRSSILISVSKTRAISNKYK